jgi:hypothetical protein
MKVTIGLLSVLRFKMHGAFNLNRMDNLTYDVLGFDALCLIDFGGTCLACGIVQMVRKRFVIAETWV